MRHRPGFAARGGETRQVSLSGVGEVHIRFQQTRERTNKPKRRSSESSGTPGEASIISSTKAGNWFPSSVVYVLSVRSFIVSISVHFGHSGSSSLDTVSISGMCESGGVPPSGGPEGCALQPAPDH